MLRACACCQVTVAIPFFALFQVSFVQALASDSKLNLIGVGVNVTTYMAMWGAWCSIVDVKRETPDGRAAVTDHEKAGTGRLVWLHLGFLAVVLSEQVMFLTSPTWSETQSSGQRALLFLESTVEKIMTAEFLHCIFGVAHSSWIPPVPACVRTCAARLGAAWRRRPATARPGTKRVPGSPPAVALVRLDGGGRLRPNSPPSAALSPASADGMTLASAIAASGESD